jgi:hypothetical protein
LHGERTDFSVRSRIISAIFRVVRVQKDFPREL